jgi:hypothetical protein
MLSACDVSTAYLLMTQTNDSGALSSSYETESALFSFIFIISNAILLRLIETRKSKSGEMI